MDRIALRIGIAFIWLYTGLAVLHPFYRRTGIDYLEPLGLPSACMYLCCVFEVFLGLCVLLLPGRLLLAVVQLVLMAGFTIVLAVVEPRLLVDPFGVLSKNVPLCCFVVASYLLERDRRADGWLRFGAAFIWVWEGIFPAVLFQSQPILDVLSVLPLPPVDPSLLLTIAGLCQAAGGIAVLLLRGLPRKLLVASQSLGLAVICVLVTIHRPELWMHPFGPIAKNVPILIGTLLVLRLADEVRQ